MSLRPMLITCQEATPAVPPPSVWDEDTARDALAGLGKTLRAALSARPVTDLTLSHRALTLLARHGVQSVGELLRRSADDLLALDGVGSVVLREIEAALRLLHVALRQPEDDAPVRSRDAGL